MHTIHDDCLQPAGIVSRYYKALYSADLESVKNLMTEESYYMTLEPFCMSLFFKDSAFKRVWDKIEESQDALDEIEKKLSVEILSRDLSPQIGIQQVEPNGSERMTVHYEKDGKKKKMHFSQQDGNWLINYFAGRPIPPVPDSYFTSMKKWFISIWPSFK